MEVAGGRGADGVDLDGSGDYAAMDKAITSAPQYQGAAGRSSLAGAYDEAEHTIDVNTRIDTTYADQAGVPPKDRKGGPGSPIRDPIKQKRPPNPKQVPELFSEVGVDWVNRPRKPDAAPGKDELWRPWHKQGRFFYSCRSKPSDGAHRRKGGRPDKTRREQNWGCTLIRHEKEEFRNCLLEKGDRDVTW